MVPEAKKTRRKPRADSVRNREILLKAATEIFSVGGTQASLEAVAKKAGVGIGTLYRHFPSREELFEAVYRHEVDQLCDLASTLGHETDAFAALRQWLQANVRLVATKKGMMQALQLAVYGNPELKASSTARMVEALDLLLQRAVAGGSLRDDISAEDLLRTLIGIYYAQPENDWQAKALKLLDIFLDGLRAKA
ncbi:transcriptional regulator [Rhizobium sp. Root149]|jgi:AcrR family transcriptional regulator|uniref:AcrR family transcriptional regulator n=2 Tax=Rhizobium rhizoryzae TaxID=451876 RepID=A0A7W6LH64_9HYPH|nr:TetR/AcrR family transcriptional regulator [Rhizobium rhizoryzae]KQZ48522.1 transcriptional regulator [Rhizobium sp. Root149]MBB4144290.1 AcrR family transcriptional regulator [Rhizobium rhizoryzae]